MKPFSCVDADVEVARGELNDPRVRALLPGHAAAQDAYPEPPPGRLRWKVTALVVAVQLLCVVARVGATVIVGFRAPGGAVVASDSKAVNGFGGPAPNLCKIVLLDRDTILALSGYAVTRDYDMYAIIREAARERTPARMQHIDDAIAGALRRYLAHMRIDDPVHHDRLMAMDAGLGLTLLVRNDDGDVAMHVAQFTAHVGPIDVDATHTVCPPTCNRNTAVSTAGVAVGGDGAVPVERFLDDNPAYFLTATEGGVLFPAMADLVDIAIKLVPQTCGGPIAIAEVTTQDGAAWVQQTKECGGE